LTVSLTVPIAACSASPEQSIVSQFFAASRLRDLTALGSLATVTFEPTSQGIITTFSITSVAVRREGDRVSKLVTIDAPVRLPGGQTVQKTLVVTLQRAEIKGEGPSGERWTITNVNEASAAPAAPPTPPS
jgi:hypothetical protein